MLRSFLILVTIAGFALPLDAKAGDDLAGAAEAGVMIGSAIMLRDTCAVQGFIPKDSTSSDEKFAHVLKSIRDQKPVRLPEGVTIEKIVDAYKLGFDAVKKGVADKPIPVSKERCERLQQDWPKFSKQFGLE